MADRTKTLDKNIAKNLAMLADIKVQVTIEVGSVKLPLREVLALSSGNIVELQQKSSEPLTLKVGDKILAYCELVTTNRKIAIRITEICGEDMFSQLMQAV
jgi:flagellar motor switch protein FliN/FliY